LKRYWSKLASSLTPYVPGEQPRMTNLIKLNTNENPYPPSPAVKQAIQSAQIDLLRLYPDPLSTELIKGIAMRHGVSEDSVFVGNGSDEVLAFCFMAFFDAEHPILFPDITYSFYEVYASLCRIQSRLIPLTQDFRIDPDDYRRDSGGVVIANPNAPTAIALNLDEIRTIVKSCSRAAIIDEAYVEFCNQSALPLLDECDNIIVVRTLSKSHSLAGMRVGYAVAQPDLIAALNCIKNSFNSYTLDRLAQAAALAALQDEAYCQSQIQRVVHTRDVTIQELKRLGFSVLPSQANFVFMTHPDIHASELAQRLRQSSIIVRHFAKPRIDDYLRVTIGTQEQMQALIDTLGAILQ
jgi:histidinol-phosphate aminotransferase